MEQLEEDDGGDRLREDVRGEEDHAEQAPPSHPPVEEQRDPERERQLEDERQRNEDPVVLHRLAERGIAERLAVVVEADEVAQRTKAVPVVGAVTDRLDDRHDQEDHVQRDGGGEEHPDLEPPAPETNDGRSRRGATGRRAVETRHYFRLAADWISATTCAGVALPANCLAIAPFSACPISAE